MYALHHLREMGLSVRVYDGAGGIGPGGGNPGASMVRAGYTFSEELVREWDWAETQPSQEQVLDYLETSPTGSTCAAT